MGSALFKKAFFGGASVLAGIVCVGCSSQRFSPVASPQALATPPVIPPPVSAPVQATPTPPGPAVLKTVNEDFTQGNAGNQIDILVVNDNSASMYELQSKLAARFGNLISSISDMDYQIGMTTTDLDSTNYNQGGRLMTWSGTSSTILTPATPNAAAVFSNSVMRPETLNCDLWSGNCPSGNEQPLLATIAAIAQKNTANAGFFRDNTPLVVVILSNEDEKSDLASGATTVQNVLDTVQTAFGGSKRFVTFSIIVKPGDAKCLNEQRAQAGGDPRYSAYGTRAFELAFDTGGQSISICSADYSQPLADMSLSMRRLITTYNLKTTPKNGKVKVTFTPHVKIGYTVEGRKLILDKAPPRGTKIAVEYEED